MKLGPIWKIGAVILLLLASAMAIHFLDHIPARRPIIETPIVQPSPSSQPLTEQVSSLALGTVAVQTFSGSTLIRLGSGTVVSSDGLIITTSAVAPYGPGSYIYQIATATGSLLRASSVLHDSSGLVLLKVNASELNTVLFDENISFQAGTDVVLVGAFVRLSHYTSIVIPAVVPYVTDGRDIPLSAAPAFTSMLAAARVVDPSGHSLGLVQLGGAYPRMIPAVVLNAFIERYLAQTRKP
jgi:hypothetical protein